MPSLRELQLRFAHSVTAPRAPADPRIAIYRHNIAANVLNALAATFAATRASMGAARFEDAVREFSEVSPPRCGDLNLYGDAFADFLSREPPAHLPRGIADLARLEWALDEAGRAGHAALVPAQVLEAVARATGEGRDFGLSLHPSCRLLALSHGVMETWRAHATGEDAPLGMAARREDLLVRREGTRPCVERLAPCEHAWLERLDQGASLESATSRALESDAAFDLAARLRERIADGTFAGVR